VADVLVKVAVDKTMDVKEGLNKDGKRRFRSTHMYT